VKVGRSSGTGRVGAGRVGAAVGAAGTGVAGGAVGMLAAVASSARNSDATQPSFCSGSRTLVQSRLSANWRSPSTSMRVPSGHSLMRSAVVLGACRSETPLPSVRTTNMTCGVGVGVGTSGVGVAVAGSASGDGLVCASGAMSVGVGTGGGDAQQADVARPTIASMMGRSDRLTSLSVACDALIASGIGRLASFLSASS
jgi:hypothetical protein